VCVIFKGEETVAGCCEHGNEHSYWNWQ